MKQKCVNFSKQLKARSLERRFAPVVFGDAPEEPWLDKHEFAGNVEEFQKWVAGSKRFDGGDLGESTLDAVQAAFR